MKFLLFLLPTLALALCFGGCATGTTQASRVKAFKTKFQNADANCDGKVSQKEFRYTMIEEVFARSDKNKNGSLTLEEFVAAGGSPASFKKIDLNGNGVLTLEEAKSAKIAMDPVTAAFFGADVDQDGYVTLGEALSYRKKARAYTRGE
jgi:Ca2+-binding EF-hand superfamily protein